MPENRGLKEKTISGMIWSFSDSMAGQVIQFIVGLILARILTPAEFGLVGMITVFIAVSQSFIDSGFSQALIRKPDVSENDYSTVFYFNIFAGLIFFLLFLLAAPGIARFYNEPELQPLVRILSLTLIINSFGLIQRTILTRAIDFRLQTRITVSAAIISGSLGIYMALNGYGVWSLVWKSLTGYLVQTILLWYYSTWKPKLIFSYRSFRELFSFGSKLLASGLLDTIYRNIYPLIIGKFFSAQDLGYYSRADQFNKFPSQNITGAVQRVSYPALSLVQDDPDKLKRGYRQVITTTMFITFFIMLGMAATAKNLIIVLIGERWLPSVPYLQLLCVGGMLFPLHAINLNMLKVKGRSDLFLRLEIIKKIMAIPVIAAGIYLGIYVMLAGMALHSFIAYFMNSHYSGRLIGYPVAEQLRDILPTFTVALTISAIVFCISIVIDVGPLFMLIIQVLSGVALSVIVCEISGLKSYLEIKSLVNSRIAGLK
jgi:O-antigen/teichoic acid export membrane protein